MSIYLIQKHAQFDSRILNRFSRTLPDAEVYVAAIWTYMCAGSPANLWKTATNVSDGVLGSVSNKYILQLIHNNNLTRQAVVAHTHLGFNRLTF